MLYHLTLFSITCSDWSTYRALVSENTTRKCESRKQCEWKTEIESCSPGQGRYLSPRREQWTGCKEHWNRTAGVYVHFIQFSKMTLMLAVAMV